jgi:hypothetical protein
MGGQDGFSRDNLTYNSESVTAVGGFKIHSSEKSTFGFSVAWTNSSAALDPFDLPADDYVAITPPMTYDFSLSHTFSDLDVSRIDADILFKYKFSDSFWLRADYRVTDYKDDAPYLYDTSGKVQWLTAAAGFRF